ncbi:hypothetical protein [Sinorhizobium meliloti]|uniref:hypothetical protein n=1 Tax=Rhizobium meliloti TaxID=382 RepID=UPI003F5CD43D
MGNLSGGSFLVQLKAPESKPFSNNSQRGADTNIAMRRDGRMTPNEGTSHYGDF